MSIERCSFCQRYEDTDYHLGEYSAQTAAYMCERCCCHSGVGEDGLDAHLDRIESHLTTESAHR